MKLTIIKVTADGEQCSVECQIGGDELKLHKAGKVHLREVLSPAFDLLDARLLEMNKRIMAANYLVNKLTPEARLAIDNVMDVLHGRTAGPAVEKVLEASRAEVEAARKRGEEQGEEVKTPEGLPTGKRRRKVSEPLAQGSADGPQGEVVNLEDLKTRLEEITGGAE